MLAAPAADMEAQFGLIGLSPPFSAPMTLVVMPDECQSIPITAPNDSEPERVGQPAQQLVAAILMHDRLADHRPEPRHPLAQPLRHPPAMQRQVGTPVRLAMRMSPFRAMIARNKQETNPRRPKPYPQARGCEAKSAGYRPVAPFP